MPVEDKASALLSGDEMDQFRSRWTTIQAKFVDDPRSAVQEADSLVAELMKRIAETFAKERQGLERCKSEYRRPACCAPALPHVLQPAAFGLRRFLLLKKIPSGEQPEGLG
jgi:hypothetical protein